MINMLPLVNQMVKKNHSLPFIVIAVASSWLYVRELLEIDVYAIACCNWHWRCSQEVAVEKAYETKDAIPESFKNASAEVEKLTPKESAKTLDIFLLLH